MANFRTGAPVTRDAVSLILATLDRIKGLLQALEQKGAEPHGNDKDLIARLEQMAAAPEVSITARAGLAGGTYAAAPIAPVQTARGDAIASSTVESAASDEKRAEAVSGPGGGSCNAGAGFDPAPNPASSEDERADTKTVSGSVRVHVNTLDQLMTTVSELVLTRNQLMEIVRRHQDSRVQDPAAAAVKRHRRAAGKRAENPHAAGRKRLAEAAAHRARSLGRVGQADRPRNAGCRDRARPAGAGSNQGPADAHGPQRCGSWDRDAAAASRGGQTGTWPDSSLRLARGRPHPGRNLR